MWNIARFSRIFFSNQKQKMQAKSLVQFFSFWVCYIGANLGFFYP